MLREWKRYLEVQMKRIRKRKKIIIKFQNKKGFSINIILRGERKPFLYRFTLILLFVLYHINLGMIGKI